MIDDRRHQLDPEIILAIQDAVHRAFEDNAHRCLMGFTENDKKGLVVMKCLGEDYPAEQLRESFRLLGLMVKTRNVAGNVFMVIFFGGLFAWGLFKLFPEIFKR